MKICCIRNISFEGPGRVGIWAEQAGHDFRSIMAYAGEKLPNTGEMDCLVVMGGPMGANDEDKFPWLAGIKALMGDMIISNKPVLGICLGAQLLASTLGSAVYRNEYKEIGWFPVELTDSGSQHPLTRHLPPIFNTFHWHSDTFDLPEGAEHIARSTGCEHQAFAFRKAVGLQFHMEMTTEGMSEICERCADELVDATFIQTKSEMMKKQETETNHRWLDRLLDAWTALGLSGI